MYLHSSQVPRGTASLLVFLGIALLAQAQTKQDRGPLMREQKIIQYTKTGLAEIEVTEHYRPPFYRGPMPLKYRTGQHDFGGSTIRWTVWSDFGTFKVDYAPGSQRRVEGFGVSVPGNGRALDPRGRLLAEARGIGLKKAVGFELEETHYSADMVPIFKCRSFIDFDGHKVQEIVLMGTKVSEYFFVWPTGH
jgi:hypothetical protein